MKAWERGANQDDINTFQKGVRALEGDPPICPQNK